MTSSNVQLGALSLLILLSFVGSLAYLGSDQPDSLRYSRDGVPFYAPVIEHPETGQCLTTEQFAEHFLH